MIDSFRCDAVTSPSFASLFFLVTHTQVDQRKVKRDGKARVEMANQAVDAFQSYSQGFQHDESQTLATEVMSKIKRLEVKGQKKKKKKKNVSEVD